MKSESYKRKVDARDELLTRTLDPAACIKKREDQVRRKTRDLRTRVAKALRTVMEFSNIYCELQQIFHLNTKLEPKYN